jgi:hypothetical protein
MEIGDSVQIIKPCRFRYKIGILTEIIGERIGLVKITGTDKFIQVPIELEFLVKKTVHQARREYVEQQYNNKKGNIHPYRRSKRR